MDQGVNDSSRVVRRCKFIEFYLVYLSGDDRLSDMS